jgi:1-deoxyxylulose-5-phosphate synthase
MDYVNLGRSGLKVSPICIGCMGFGSSAWREWVLDEDQARPILQRAFELGINFFDTADMYSIGASEEVLGRAVRDFSSRDQAIIATKVFYPVGQGPNDRGLSRKHILESIDNSLRRLGTDYVDLYQVHRWDPSTPVEETLRTLEDLVRAGKVRYIGASSAYAWQLAQALAMQDGRGWARFVSMQNHYNLVYREEEREMIPLCQKEGVGLIPWSPLARGLLAGRRAGESATTRARTDTLTGQFYYQEADQAVADRCHELSRRRDVPPVQIAIAWLLHKGVTAPIVGVTKLRQVDEIAGAAGLTLTQDEIDFLEELYVPHPVVGIDVVPPRSGLRV